MNSANWKQLAGFTKYDGTPTDSQRLSDAESLAIPIGTNSIPHTIAHALPTKISFDNKVSSVFSDDISTQQNVMQVSEGATTTPTEPTTITEQPVSAGVSSRGRVWTMSQAMREAVSQWSFYGNRGMHHMQALHAVMSLEEAELNYACEYDFHFGLQERMHHPIAFHAEMMVTLCISIKSFSSLMRENLSRLL